MNKYNQDIQEKYEKLLNIRSNRQYTISDITWKPIISSNTIDKLCTNTNDIKLKYEILIKEREINNINLININLK